MTPTGFRIGSAALFILSMAAPAASQVGYTGGTYVVRQTIDGERADAVYILNSIDLSRARWRATVSLPYVVQRSLPGIQTSSMSSTWSRGFGDPVVRMDVEVTRARQTGVGLALNGAVKMPIASVDRGFGSGEVDLAFGATVNVSRGRNLVVADASLWVLGDPPGVVLRDVPAIQVGYARVLDRAARWSTMVSIGASPGLAAGLSPPAQIGVTLLRAFPAGTALGVTGSWGLTAGSADAAFGVSWRAGF